MRTTGQPESSKERRTTVLAAATIVAAVGLLIAAASGALSSSPSTAEVQPGASTARPVGQSGVAAAMATTSNRVHHVGTRGCDDDRAARQARSLETPWCTLNRAIRATPAGGVIEVAPGRYAALQFRGPRQLDLTVRAADPRRPPSVDGVRIDEASDLKLSRLRFVDSGGLSRVDDIVIEANIFPSSTLYVRGGRRVRVVKNRIGNLRGDRRAMLFQGSLRAGDRPSEDIVVRGNRIDDIQHDGIDFYAGYRRVTIEANHITNVRQPPNVKFHTDAIQLTGGEDLKLRDNRVEGVTHAIIIKDVEPTVRAVISGNLVARVDGASLQLFNAPGARILQNTFWDNQVSLVLDNDPRVPGRTSAVIEDNVMQQLVAKRGTVAQASGNVFRYGKGAGKPVYRGRPNFRDKRAGDYRLRPTAPGLGIPADELLPGTRLGSRP